MKITVLYSLPAYLAPDANYRQADDDTYLSAMEVSQVLAQKGLETVLMPLNHTDIHKLKDISSTDMVFNLIEWTGKDLPYSLEAIDYLEKSGIPFTGAGSKVFESTSDKSLMKKILINLKAPVPKYSVYKNGDEISEKDIVYPQLIKLVSEHCSIGITKDCIVTDHISRSAKIYDMLKRFDQSVMSEEYIDGREFQVTVIDMDSGPVMLPASEIVFKGQGLSPILTFDSRWNENHADYGNSHVMLADLSPELESNLRSEVLDVFINYPLPDYARFDIRLRDNIFYILEANSNPGLGDDEEYGMTLSQKAAGMSFADFCLEIVKSCSRRFKLKEKFLHP